MKKMLLIPLTLVTLQVCAYETRPYQENFYAEATPAYTPPKPGQPSSSTYQATPSTPTQTSPTQGTNRVNSAAPNPSYSNSQHPYGPPGAPSSSYQRPASSPQTPARSLPSHPYGPPGSGHSLAEASNENNEEETPYEKNPFQTQQTANVNKPSVYETAKPTASDELKNGEVSEKDKHKTESDRVLNKKVRDTINDGFEDSFPGIVLITSDGVVVIEGTVPNIESHDKLEKTISKIDGVKSVTNNTTVKSRK